MSAPSGPPVGPFSKPRKGGVSGNTEGRGQEGSSLACAQIDPWRAVASGLELAGEAGPRDLIRLAEALEHCGGGAEWPARYRLRFGRDTEGRAVVLGGVELTLRLTCQRCLGEVAMPVDTDLALGLVRDGMAGGAESDGLPDRLDPLPVGPEAAAQSIRPLDLVEDELLLAMPQVPAHPAGECEPPGQALPPPEAAVAEAQKLASPHAAGSLPASPFAVLANLKLPGSEPHGGED